MALWCTKRTVPMARYYSASLTKWDCMVKAHEFPVFLPQYFLYKTVFILIPGLEIGELAGVDAVEFAGFGFAAVVHREFQNHGDNEHADRVVAAGARVLVGGNAVFGARDRACAIDEMRQAGRRGLANWA